MGSFKEDYKICHRLGKRIDPEQMEFVHEIKKDSSVSCIVSPSGKYIATDINHDDDFLHQIICVASTEKYRAKLLEPIDKNQPGCYRLIFNRTEEYLAVLVDDYGNYDDDDLQPDCLNWINIYKVPNFELCKTIKCDDETDLYGMVWLGD